MSRILGRLSINEWLTLVISVASIFVALASLVVSYWTYRISADSSDIKLAIRHLDALATQTKRQADLLAFQLQQISLTFCLRRQSIKMPYSQLDALATQTKRQADLLAFQLQQIKMQTASGMRSAEALGKQVDIASDNQRRSARAYIAVVQNSYIAALDQSLLLKKIEPGHAAQAEVTFSNSAKDPTVNASLWANAILRSNDHGIARESRRAIAVPSVFSDTEQVPILVEGEVSTPQQVKEFGDGHLRAYVFGELRYGDVFGKLHHTRFCFWFASVGGRETACRIYNNSD